MDMILSRMVLFLLIVLYAIKKRVITCSTGMIFFFFYNHRLFSFSNYASIFASSGMIQSAVPCAVYYLS